MISLAAIFGIFNERVIEHDSDDEINIPLEFDTSDEPTLAYLERGEYVWARILDEQLYIGNGMPRGVYFLVQPLNPVYGTLAKWINENKVVILP